MQFSFFFHRKEKKIDFYLDMISWLAEHIFMEESWEWDRVVSLVLSDIKFRIVCLPDWFQTRVGQSALLFYP